MNNLIGETGRVVNISGVITKIGARGEKGDTGAQGEKGEKGERGDAFVFSDFTQEQLAALKGEKGDINDFVSVQAFPIYNVESSVKGYVNADGLVFADNTTPTYYSELIEIIPNTDYYIGINTGYIDIADVGYKPVWLYTSDGDLVDSLMSVQITQITLQKMYKFNTGSANKLRLQVQANNLTDMYIRKAPDDNVSYTLSENVKVSDGSIEENSIAGDKLGDSTVYNSKLADQTITGDKIADYSISDGKLTADLFRNLQNKGPWVRKTGRKVEICPNDRSIVEIEINGETTQEGTGDPSPQNVRKMSGISGNERITTIGCSADRSKLIALPGVMHGIDGIYDTFEPRVLIDGEDKSRETKRFATLILTGSEETAASDTGSESTRYRWRCETGLTNIADVQACSHFKQKLWATGPNSFYLASTLPVGMLYINYECASADELKAYLAAQNAAGTPVTIVYELAESQVTLGAPEPELVIARQEDKFAPGMLTAAVTLGTVTAGYNQDMTYTYNELKNAIIATGGNV